jgi:hypothetical protein
MKKTNSKKKKNNKPLSLYPMKLDEALMIALNPDENKKKKKQSKIGKNND